MQRLVVSQQYPGIANVELVLAFDGHNANLNERVYSHMVAAAHTNLAQLPTLIESVTYDRPDMISSGQKLTDQIGSGRDTIKIEAMFEETKDSLPQPVAEYIISNILTSVQGWAQSARSGLPIMGDPYTQLFTQHAVETRALFRQDQLRESGENSPLAFAGSRSSSARSQRRS